MKYYAVSLTYKDKNGSLTNTMQVIAAKKSEYAITSFMEMVKRKFINEELVCSNALELDIKAINEFIKNKKL